MELGIIGLSQSGKTTVFNALTRGHAETSTFGASLEPNIGVVKVPDPRLDALVPLFKPKKTVYADVRYVDFPATAMAGFGKEGPSGQFIAALARMDAFIQVVRAFENAAVPHAEGSIDPARDIAALHLELIFADLAFLERQLERMDTAFRSARATEREGLQRQVNLYKRLKGVLEREEPLRDHEINDEERKMLSGFPLLTLKPVLVLLNVDESAAGRTAEIAEAQRAALGGAHVDVLAVAGKLEEDLAQMEPDEAEVFRQELGVEGSGLDAVIRHSYTLLGLISFLTVGPDECRAWTIHRGDTAPEAAGAIHSDLQRGFIRAEVIHWQELLDCGSYAEARKKGLLRSEGKTYVVQDGDVLNILFNV